MKKILISFGTVVAIILVIVVVPTMITVNSYKDAISAMVKARTGRDLTINGAMKFTLLPRFTLTLHDGKIANPQGFNTPHTLSFSELKVAIDPVAFLDTVIEISEIKVKNLQLYLEKNKEGEVNWLPELPSKENLSNQLPEPAESDSQTTLFYINKIFIENGRVSYTNDGKEILLSDITSKLAFSPTDQVLAAVTSMRFGEHFIDSILTIKEAQNIFTGKAFGMSLSLSEHGRKLAVTGSMVAANKQFSIYKADFSLDSLKAQGDIKIDASQTPVTINGTLQGSRVDLTSYIKSGNSAHASKELHQGWSTTPISFDMLKKAQVNLYYSGPLKTDSLTIDDSELLLTIKDGLLTLVSHKLQLYGGNAKLHATINTNDAKPSLAVSMGLLQVRAEQLLQHTALTSIQGNTNATIEVVAKGGHEKELIESLEGNGTIKVENGMIEGIDMFSLDRPASMPMPTSLPVAKKGRTKTSFQKLTGSFVIDRGIVANNDLKLEAPSLTVAGDGSINLPEYTLDYRLTPTSQAVNNLQAGDIGITVKGKLDHPSISLDVSTFIKKNMPKIKDTVNDALKRLKDAMKR